MKLQEKITGELKSAIKNRQTARTSAIRVLIGEFQRQPDKDLSDEQVVGIIRKLVKAERDLLAVSGGEDSEFIEILEGYLPAQASDQDILDWIREHIDFGEFKNKMQAMRPIMSHFGSSADGNQVKKLLQELDD